MGFLIDVLHSPLVAIPVCQCQPKGKAALETGIVKISAKKAVKSTEKYKTINPSTKHFSHTC